MGAKTCPDNPRGLYPKGGGCVFCGSVEHLKRDCPRKVEKDMKQGVRVGMIGDSSLEDEQVYETTFRSRHIHMEMYIVVRFWCRAGRCLLVSEKEEKAFHGFNGFRPFQVDFEFPLPC